MKRKKLLLISLDALCESDFETVRRGILSPRKRGLSIADVSLPHKHCYWLHAGHTPHRQQLRL